MAAHLLVPSRDDGRIRPLQRAHSPRSEGGWVDAEMLLYEARQVRCEIDGLQEQL